MNEQTIILLFMAVVFALLLAAAVLEIVRRVRQVISSAIPYGWEDEEGFHRGKKGGD